MSIPLPPDFERAVLDRIRSGRYASAEEVLAAMMEALDDAEAELDDLRREVQVGFDEIERGQVVDGEEAFAWLRDIIGKRGRSGRYASIRELLQAVLEVMEESEEEKVEALRREVKIGLDQLDRGERYTREEVLARLREARPGARI